MTENKCAPNEKSICEIPTEGNFVLAKYDETIYPVKVLEVDTNENDARVSFILAGKE